MVLYDAMSSKSDTAQQIYAAVYILIWLLLSHIIFSDLFVAVLIENFEIAETVRLIAEPGRISTFRNYVKMSYKRYRDLIANAASLPIENIARQESETAAAQVETKSSLVSKESFYETAVVIHNSISHRLILEAVTAVPHRHNSEDSENDAVDEDNSLFFFPPSLPFYITRRIK